jgi:hypothetical protein
MAFHLRRVPVPVTVGTAIANRPPCRSVQAGLPHTAPTLDGWRRNARQGKDAGRENGVSTVQRLGERFQLGRLRWLRRPSMARHRLHARRLAIDANDRGLIIRHRGECVGVEDHSQSPGSIFANSLLMIRLIRTVWLWRCLRPPASLTQGYSSFFKQASSFSVTASVTKTRSGMPRCAATDLARRKMGSGISRVVFTLPGSHSYGR